MQWISFNKTYYAIQQIAILFIRWIALSTLQTTGARSTHRLIILTPSAEKPVYSYNLSCDLNFVVTQIL